MSIFRGFLRWVLPLLLLAAGGLQSHAEGNATDLGTVYVRSGQTVVVEAGPCLQVTEPAQPPDRLRKVSGAGPDGATPVWEYLLYTAPAADTGSLEVIVQKGTAAKGDGTCENAAAVKHAISSDRTPEIPSTALDQSFRILLTAFVLALLLESAFALLFNWRLFQEFFVGRAWRTPIMFAGALLVVRNFDLDLMARLFEAYNPRAAGAQPATTWFTSLVTAAILAGGSVGVNRILVALGFRSQVREETQAPPLDEKEAWVAIRVRDGGTAAGDVKVNIDEVAITQGNPLPAATVGIIRPRAVDERLRELLFPSRSRVPRSGGRKVSTEKVYEITVESGGHIYDASTGLEVGSGTGLQPEVKPFRFASRAIVDFDVKLK